MPLAVKIAAVMLTLNHNPCHALKWQHPALLTRGGSTIPTTEASSKLSMTAVSSENVAVTKRKRISDALGRVYDSVRSKDRSREELSKGIAAFYDRSSPLWEQVWGEHMHHGYYVPPTRTDHEQAQIDMIDEVLRWTYQDVQTKNKKSKAEKQQPKMVVDVGCGIGGSSRHMARKYSGDGKKCQTFGVTLSPYQAQRATELAKEAGLEEQCHFQVADALDMPFQNNTFDLAWSLESGEHMPDKAKFVSELFRVIKPGGKVIIVTWCHRDLPPNTKLTRKEERLLRKINRAYYLPPWCSVADYVDLIEKSGQAVAMSVRTEDWSDFIAPFWKAVIKSSLSVESVVGLCRSGWKTIRGAYAMFLMLKGYHMGLIKFGLITATKKK